MTSGIINTSTPVEHALCSTEESLVELITVLGQGGMDHYDEADKTAVLDRVQKVLSMMQAADAEVIAACRDGGVPEKECQRSMTKVLERRCLIGPGEANRRVKAAEAIGPRMSPTGLPLPRLRPQIADAMSIGAVNADQLRVVREGLNQLDTAGIDPDTIDTVETELVNHCTRFGPKELSRICQSYRDTLDPDGPEPDEERNRDQRNVELRPMANGAYKLEGRLTGELGAKLAAILSPLAKPRAPKTHDLDNTGGVSTVDLLDQRTHGQRMHDALDDAASRLLRSGDLPDSGGTPASVIITIDHNDLLTHTQHWNFFTRTEWVCTHCGATNQPDGDHQDHATARNPTGDQTVQKRDRPEPDPNVDVHDRRTRTSPNDNEHNHRCQPDPSNDSNNHEDHAGLNKDPAGDKPDDASPTDENQAVRTGRNGDQDHDHHPSGNDQVHENRPDPTTTAQPAPTSLHPPGRVRRKRPGHGTTSFGATLSVPELLRLAGQADIYPVVMTAHGQLLDMGRSRRIATKTQTMALIARDGGCSFPGCDHPPEWCERHHIISWLLNGKTSVDNLTLLCSHHHHQFLLRGWNVQINKDGLPEWTPPHWIDPEQKPMINNRIIARIHQAALINE